MFCMQCGALFEKDEIKCTKCNTKFGKGQRFCCHCGAKMVHNDALCPVCKKENLFDGKLKPNNKSSNKSNNKNIINKNYLKSTETKQSNNIKENITDVAEQIKNINEEKNDVIHAKQNPNEIKVISGTTLVLHRKNEGSVPNNVINKESRYVLETIDIVKGNPLLEEIATRGNTRNDVADKVLAEYLGEEYIPQQKKILKVPSTNGTVKKVIDEGEKNERVKSIPLVQAEDKIYKKESENNVIDNTNNANIKQSVFEREQDESLLKRKSDNISAEKQERADKKKKRAAEKAELKQQIREEKKQLKKENAQKKKEFKEQKKAEKKEFKAHKKEERKLKNKNNENVKNVISDIEPEENKIIKREVNSDNSLSIHTDENANTIISTFEISEPGQKQEEPKADNNIKSDKKVFLPSLEKTREQNKFTDSLSLIDDLEPVYYGPDSDNEEIMECKTKLRKKTKSKEKDKKSWHTKDTLSAVSLGLALVWCIADFPTAYIYAALALIFAIAGSGRKSKTRLSEAAVIVLFIGIVIKVISAVLNTPWADKIAEIISDFIEKIKFW